MFDKRVGGKQLETSAQQKYEKTKIINFCGLI